MSATVIASAAAVLTTAATVIAATLPEAQAILGPSARVPNYPTSGSPAFRIHADSCRVKPIFG